MRKRLGRLAMVLVALLLCLAASRAQVQTEQPPPGAPTTAPAPGETPPSPDAEASPGLEASPSPRARPLIKTGRIDVHVLRFGYFRWRYRVENGTANDVTAIHMLVPTEGFDSRAIPLGPGGWLARREPAQGSWSGSWLLSWYGVGQSRIMAGTFMDLDIRSGAPMLSGTKNARMLFAAALPERLVRPWDEAFLTLPVKETAPSGPERTELGGLPFPAFAYHPPKGPVTPIQDAEKVERVVLQIFGEGQHSGEAFLLSARARDVMIATLERGTLLVPTLPQFDQMMVGRDERIHLDPQDDATIRLRCFSVTYGRRAPPARLSQHDLKYQIVSGERAATEAPVAHANLATFRGILERADQMTPQLATPVGQDYPDLMTQWALWRQERILTGQPLDMRDVERDLGLYYRMAGLRRVYLNPIQVRELSRRIWADTDRLLYPTLPL
ncbi:MAG: hypothetical protein FJX76_01300 [Armatimonadetes bacterium]|nr:hypothetical protein [Armatimonadota bacterium]